MGTAGGFTSILHITGTGADCCKPGDRVPAVYFWSNTNKLHICFPVDDRGNQCVNKGIPKDKTAMVTIEQRSVQGTYKTIVSIDGAIIDTKTHTKEPMEYTSAKVYASDPWKPAALAEVKNFQFKNLGKCYR